MLTQTVEYALRALVAMAAPPRSTANESPVGENHQGSRTVSVKSSATAHARGTRRGPSRRSGRLLPQSPCQQITILEAVNAVDPIRRIKTCPLGLKAHGKRLCPLHKKMDAALAQMEQAFASTTLADVLAEPTKSVALCAFPPLVCAN